MKNNYDYVFICGTPNKGNEKNFKSSYYNYLV